MRRRRGSSAARTGRRRRIAAWWSAHDPGPRAGRGGPGRAPGTPGRWIACRSAPCGRGCRPGGGGGGGGGGARGRAPCVVGGGVSATAPVLGGGPEALAGEPADVLA